MMAAAMADQQNIQFKSSSKLDILSISSDGEEVKSRSDTSEQEYFDAKSHVSTQSFSENHDIFDPSQDEEASDSLGPKIVETVVKKHFETESGDSVAELEPEPEPEIVFPGIVKHLNKSNSESVIEREIRHQKEREEEVIREREEALRRAATYSNTTNSNSIQLSPKPIPLPTVYSAPNYYVQTSFQEIPSAINTSLVISSFNPAETRIALELREMREREEELRKLRKQVLTGTEDFEAQVTTAVDDGFSSFPNIDEGNFSEHGSEEREISETDDTLKVINPEVSVKEELTHHRTQSVDSTSSGHSSGSGGVSEGTLVRRRVIVKPFEDPQDEDIPPYMRKQKETPIEREIRLAREREEELRREKGLSLANGPITPTLPKKEVNRFKSPNKVISNDPRSVQHRLATSRIQHEIDEAAERESELRDAGTIQTTSEETLDSKVTRFTDLMEYSIEEQDRKMHLLSQPSAQMSSVDSETDNSAVTSLPTEKVANMVSPTPSVQNNMLSTRLNNKPQATRYSVPLVPKGQKGLMERFLASRGKLGINSSLSSTTLSNSFGLHPNGTFHKSPILLPDDFQVTDDTDSYKNERTETSRLAIRPKYTPAEEKIQNELRDMQRREEELRLQRTRMFACSQPNLLSIMDDEEEETHLSSLDDTHILRTSQSNPNLLDSTDSKTGDESEISLEEKNYLLGSRKKSPLIAQWESIIQRSTDH